MQTSQKDLCVAGKLCFLGMGSGAVVLVLAVWSFVFSFVSWRSGVLPAFFGRQPENWPFTDLLQASPRSLQLYSGILI